MAYVDSIYVLFTAFLSTLFFLFWFSSWGIGQIREKFLKRKNTLKLFHVFLFFLMACIFSYGIGLIENFLKIVNFKDGLFLGFFLYVFIILPFQYLNQSMSLWNRKIFWLDQIFYFLLITLVSGLLAA
jgi:hypothetical protein